jgi:predicted lactoylglutathione lyase
MLCRTRRSFTDRPFRRRTAGHAVTDMDSRDAVDRASVAAAAHGGQADEPVVDHGFMYGRDPADPA